MIKDFDFDNRFRETYILAWAHRPFHYRINKTSMYKRTLNATIGRDSYKIYNDRGFFHSISDQPINAFNSLQFCRHAKEPHPLLGTILEVPDIDDVVLMRLMNPEDYINNKGINWNSENDVKHALPRIYHITPKLIYKFERFILAEQKTKEYSEQITDNKRAVYQMTQWLDRIYKIGDFTQYEQEKKDIFQFKSPAVTKFLDTSNDFAPAANELYAEIERRRKRLQVRRDWINLQIKKIWDKASFAANNFDA